MDGEKAIVIFNIQKRKFSIDLEIPLYLTANELVVALNTAYDLNIDVTDVKKCYLKSENPIAFLKGSKTLDKYGIRNGTIINFTE